MMNEELRKDLKFLRITIVVLMILFILLGYAHYKAKDKLDYVTIEYVESQQDLERALNIATKYQMLSRQCINDTEKLKDTIPIIQDLNLTDIGGIR